MSTAPRWAARLVTYYGRLAAELEEATNPSQQAWLQVRLAELDTTLERATAGLSPSRGARP